MINFKMYQDNRKKSPKKGYWYARAHVQGLADIKYLAGRISNTCTVTESDILAVISALVTEMSYALKDGKRVLINGLGSFKASFRSRGVEKLKDFKPATHIYNPRIIFLPETARAGDNSRYKTMLLGWKVSELSTYKQDSADAPGLKPKAAEGGHSAGVVSDNGTL
jgi:putative DNA-binding protein